MPQAKGNPSQRFWKVKEGRRALSKTGLHLLARDPHSWLPDLILCLLSDLPCSLNKITLPQSSAPQSPPHAHHIILFCSNILLSNLFLYLSPVFPPSRIETENLPFFTNGCLNLQNEWIQETSRWLLLPFILPTPHPHSHSTSGMIQKNYPLY